MDQKYIDAAKILKAISDPKRLQIVDMLSCGELCACVIQEEFNITQPTLSHDMKVLLDAGVVTARKEWKNTYYSLDVEYLEKFSDTLSAIFHPKAGCICQKGKPAE
jgi:ArsR family transcriptional regulator